MSFLVKGLKDMMTGEESPEYALHGLNREEDGSLTYIKSYMNSDDEIKVNAGNSPYGGLSSLQQKDNSTPVDGELIQQFRFDEKELYYYINSDGYLVARYLRNFEYPSYDGASSNWIKPA